MIPQCDKKNIQNHNNISTILELFLNQGWRTKAQLLKLHGGDQKAVDDIISNKESQGLVQDHPDISGLKTYYVS